MIPSLSHPSLPAVVGRAGSRVIRVDKLCLSLISCGTWENRPCISPGQHSGAGPDGKGKVESCSTWDHGPHTRLGSAAELALEAWVQVSWTQEHESRKADPASC